MSTETTETTALVITDFAEVVKVDAVNFDPHPFTIGPQHFPKDGSPYLGETQCRQAPCAARGCNLGYDQHTYDVVAFVKLKQDVTNSAMRNWLLDLIATKADWVPREDKRLDGFAFFANGYKILPTTEEELAQMEVEKLNSKEVTND